MNFRSIASVLLIVTSVLFSCSKKVAPQQGLVGEYLFNHEGDDNSQYHNSATIHGATPVKGHIGKKKSAYHFNGTDQYIAVPHAEQNNFEGDFSVSFWIAVEDVQKDMSAPLNDIIRKWRGDTQGYPFAIVYYNSAAHDSTRNKFSFVKYDGSICRNSPQLAAPAVSKDTFAHLVCLKKGTSLKIYRDGKLITETTDTTKPASDCGSHNNADITLGTRGNKVRFFTGSIDDVRFYNRALTDDEVRLLSKM